MHMRSKGKAAFAIGNSAASLGYTYYHDPDGLADTVARARSFHTSEPRLTNDNRVK